MLIKFIDAARNIDRSQQPTSSSDMLKYFQHDYDVDWERFDECVKAYYLIKWYCTDTCVGTLCYFMDDELVAISSQTGRKNPVEFRFISAEAKKKVHNHILTLIDPPEETDILSEEEANELLENTYTTNYVSQLLADEGFYNGMPVKVVEKILNVGPGHCFRYSDFLEVEDELGKHHIIHINDFRIPLPIKRE